MPEPRTYEFTMPMPPTRGNARGHSRYANSEKKKYYKLCDQLQLTGKVPDPPSSPITRAVATATLHAFNRQDDDNAMARLKWPIDWLKTRGYILEDRRPFLTWANVPEQVIDRSGREPVVIIKLVEVLA